MEARSLPADEKLLAAMGRVAIRHGQLDHAIRMAIKTLTGLSTNDALIATERHSSRELRERVRRLLKQKNSSEAVLIKLDVILNRARAAIDARNELLHSLWGTNSSGYTVIHEASDAHRSPPSVEDVNDIAKELEEITKCLDEERISGFLFQVSNSTQRA